MAGTQPGSPSAAREARVGTTPVPATNCSGQLGAEVFKTITPPLGI